MHLKFNFKNFYSITSIKLFLIAGLFYSILFSSLNLSFVYASTTQLEIPALNRPVTDQAGLLDFNTLNILNASLVQLKSKYGISLALLTVKSLKGQPIEQFSISVVDKWKLGKKGVDKGVLFLISLKDRKMRIEVGRGLEGVLTDLQSKRITGAVKKYFKKNDYRSGIIIGLQAIASVSGGKLESASGSRGYRKNSRRRRNSPFIIIFWIVITIIGLFGRRRGSGLGYLGAAMFLSSGNRFGSGGFGGGGGFSGGGGGFSGGGASDGW